MLTVGRREDAVALYRKAISINPENAMAHGNLGKALQDLGYIDEALYAYRTAIAYKPEDALAHGNLGAALLECGALRGGIDRRHTTRHRPPARQCDATSKSRDRSLEPGPVR